MLTPILNHPISRLESVVEFLGESGAAQHEAYITTTIRLATPLATGDEPVRLILPMSQDALQQPIVRWITEDVSGASVQHFDQVTRPEADNRVIDALQRYGELQNAAKAVDEALAAASATWSTSMLEVKPGQDRIRFFTVVAVPRDDAGVYAFATLSPLASFALQPPGKLHVVAVLPPQAQLHEAVALRDPADPASSLPVDVQTIAERPCCGFVFQNDPLFKVSYAC